MTETDAATDRASLVPGAHRLIRAIDGKEGPFAGTLITYDEGVAVCVDVERLTHWSGWAFSDADHICGVLDIRRRADGHDALLPWCTQRVEAFLGRRRASESPLTPGELGTLVVSLLRGVRELGSDADAVGDWWLTGDGRPLFVHGEGGTARALTAALINNLTHQQPDRATLRILEEMTTALRQPRHPAEDDRRWEEQLFARAAPRALRLDVFAPERVSDIAPRLVAIDATARPVDGIRRRQRARDRTRDNGVATRTRERLSALAAGAHQAAVRLFSRAARQDDSTTRPVDTAKQTPKMTRGRSLLLAGSLGAVVLLVGLLWPSDSGNDPAEASQKEATSETPNDVATAPAPTPTPTESASSPAKGGAALDAVPALLDGIAVCVTAAAGQCPSAVADGADTPSDGAATQGSSASTATLVDDYGDVAVIRLTPTVVEGSDAERAEQMMVLERRNEIWLVRDVYDVANQPD